MNPETDLRYQQLSHWLSSVVNQPIEKITPIVGDASFRRYFRVHVPTLPVESLIAMDAPPQIENCAPFITVATIFQKCGLHVPEIIQKDLAQGFLLLSDLGDALYSRVLTLQNASKLYINAIRDLLIIQQCSQAPEWHFSDFDPLLTEELLRFREWYLIKHLNLHLSAQEETLLTNTFQKLVNCAQAQPRVCVHRDYHSRNLLVLKNNQVGILDFQDAVWGPVSYDLVSLLRDCYVAWNNERVYSLAKHYHEQAACFGILKSVTWTQFIHWFDWMGIHRHLKAMYIFARKYRRDNTSAYLADIPRTLNYILTVSENYPELREFRTFLIERVLPYESHDISSWPRQPATPAHG